MKQTALSINLKGAEMQPQSAAAKSPRLYSMANDDRIFAAFSSYVYLTVKQMQEILGCKFDYIETRLRRLYQAGYLDRQQQTPFGDFTYFLTQRGGELCASRGHLPSPRWISKKSKMTLAHDNTISDFHMRLEHALRGTPYQGEAWWFQWRGDLAKQFGDWIPDAYFRTGQDSFVLEIVKSTESGYKKGESSLVTKLKTYEAEKRHVLVVMPTLQRIQNFIAKIEEEIPSSRIWFTSEERYQKDILGKIWWAPKNYRDRVYSILKPEAS
jgi:hypothetical protein